MNTAATPGLSWGGRRVLAEEDDPKPDMRSMRESTFLNSTLDKM
jgi:hypothetical protein